MTPQPLKAVGGLTDVQDMTLISDCRNIEDACKNFRRELAKASNYSEAKALFRLAKTWNEAMGDLWSRAGDRMEEL